MRTAILRNEPMPLPEPVDAIVEVRGISKTYGNIEALRSVEDPEIPINIYDLGLIYRVDISESGDVAIDMTLTAPACPVAGMMPIMVKDAVSKVEGVGLIQVDLVWDPPWSQENMSDEARLQLGLM